MLRGYGSRVYGVGLRGGPQMPRRYPCAPGWLRARPGAVDRLRAARHNARSPARTAVALPSPWSVAAARCWGPHIDDRRTEGWGCRPVCPQDLLTTGPKVWTSCGRPDRAPRVAWHASRVAAGREGPRSAQLSTGCPHRVDDTDPDRSELGARRRARLARPPYPLARRPGVCYPHGDDPRPNRPTDQEPR